jgi:hypothetical protein
MTKSDTKQQSHEEKLKDLEKRMADAFAKDRSHIMNLAKN